MEDQKKLGQTKQTRAKDPFRSGLYNLLIENNVRQKNSAVLGAKVVLTFENPTQKEAAKKVIEKHSDKYRIHAPRSDAQKSTTKSFMVSPANMRTRQVRKKLDEFQLGLLKQFGAEVLVEAVMRKARGKKSKLKVFDPLRDLFANSNMAKLERRLKRAQSLIANL